MDYLPGVTKENQSKGRLLIVGLEQNAHARSLALSISMTT